MTNEELTKSMVCRKCTCLRVCTNENFNNTCKKYDAILEMANWKEKDLFQWIKDNINEFLYVGNTDFGCFDWQIDFDGMIEAYKNRDKTKSN